MQLPVSVSNQAYIFLCSILGGILIAFIYDAFRVARKAVKTGSIVTHLEDFIFWIIVAVIMFGVVYYSNEGEIRGYIFIGTVLGVVLYVLLLSRFVMCAALFILRIIYIILKTFWMVISYPFRVMYNVASVPVRYSSKLLGKGFKGIRRAGKNQMAKASMIKRMFKNMLKKI